MEVFNGTNNQVITECGHTFHTNCLMKSVAHNGFGCPYCRTKMAEDIEDSDDDSDDYDDEEEDEEDEDDYNNNYYCGDEEMFVLDGLRWLFNRANNEETVLFEYDDEYVLRVRPTTPDTPPPSRPSVEFITKKLLEQGVTMGDIIKVLLLDHDEYESMEDELNRVEDDLFGKLRILINNYEPEQEVKTELLLSRIDDVTSYYNNRFTRVV